MEDPQPAANPSEIQVTDSPAAAQAPPISNPPPIQPPTPHTAAETSPPESNQVPDTPSATPAPPSEPNQVSDAQAPPPPPSETESRKRPLDISSNVQVLNPKGYKIRLIIKDLRPHFIEVLRTPDFRNCKAANEIKEQMKLLMELYNQMPAETVFLEKPKDMLHNQTLSPQEQPQNIPPVEPSENKTSQSVTSSEKKQQPEDNKDTLGSYIVGGSAFGWNFITFSGNVPVYYGVTKKSFLSAQAKVETNLGGA